MERKYFNINIGIDGHIYFGDEGGTLSEGKEAGLLLQGSKRGKESSLALEGEGRPVGVKIYRAKGSMKYPELKNKKERSLDFSKEKKKTELLPRKKGKVKSFLPRGKGGKFLRAREKRKKALSSR